VWSPFGSLAVKTPILTADDDDVKEERRKR
jgi:hypothetical protein